MGDTTIIHHGVKNRAGPKPEIEGIQMSEHAADILSWLWVVVVALLTLLWWFFRQERNGIYKRLDHLEARIDEVEKGVQAVTLNYTKKFDEVHQALAKMQESILERIHGLELLIVAKHGKPTTKRRSR